LLIEIRFSEIFMLLFIISILHFIYLFIIPENPCTKLLINSFTVRKENFSLLIVSY
jgi:hypothetical protein